MNAKTHTLYGWVRLVSGHFLHSVLKYENVKCYFMQLHLTVQSVLFAIVNWDWRSNQYKWSGLGSLLLQWGHSYINKTTTKLYQSNHKCDYHRYVNKYIYLVLINWKFRPTAGKASIYNNLAHNLLNAINTSMQNIHIWNLACKKLF